jgi:hypothetical protein
MFSSTSFRQGSNHGPCASVQRAMVKLTPLRQLDAAPMHHRGRLVAHEVGGTTSMMASPKRRRTRNGFRRWNRPANGVVGSSSVGDL